MRASTNLIFQAYRVLTKHSSHRGISQKASPQVRGKQMYRSSMENKQSKSSQLSWTRVFIWTLQDWEWLQATHSLKVDLITHRSRTLIKKAASTGRRISVLNIQITSRSKHTVPSSPQHLTPLTRRATTITSSTCMKGKSHPRLSCWGTPKGRVSRCTWSRRTIGNRSFP